MQHKATATNHLRSFEMVDNSFAAVQAREAEDDRRVLYRAVLAAILFHLLLFAIHLPEMIAEVPEVPEPKITVVPTQPFRPLPPEPTRVPEQLSRKVPIPDPTPELPEPIRLPELADTVFELPDGELNLAFPESPPPLVAGPVRVEGDVRPPVKTYSPSPLYTEIARRARIEGLVIIEAIIDTSGAVSTTRVLRALPMGLDRAAEDAVRQWRFEPATLNGKPVAVIFNLTVSFELT